MKAIIGLGNPDVKYVKTRHNAGFMVLDTILCKKGLALSDKFQSFFAKDKNLLLLLPKTYMNLSGVAVVELMNFYKLNIRDILIVYDDISLDIGTLRFREKGSDGGHNGIKSIIKSTGTSDFHRLKVGIGPQPLGIPSENFVLQNFTKEEFEKLETVKEKAAEACLEWADESKELDITKFQSKYNKIYV